MPSPHVSPFSNGFAEVADITPLTNALGALGQDRRAKREEDRFSELANEAFQGDDAALSRILIRSPEAAAVLSDIRRNRDVDAAQQVAKLGKKYASESAFLLSVKDERARKAQIIKMAQEAFQAGNMERAQELTSFVNIEDPDVLRMKLQRDIIDDEDAREVLGDLLSLQAGPTGGASKTLTEALDADGNLVFVQSLEAGGVREIDGFSPPGPTPREIADTRRSQITADAAEADFQSERARQESSLATRDEIATLAHDLLESGDVDAVFGSFEGTSFVPSLLEGTIDAQADVDRLVSLLTLGNLDKMSGVLSESDIKILERSGSILGEKRISDKRARKELERVREVFSRAQGPQNQSSRFKIREVR